MYSSLAEESGLENQEGVKASQGFESLHLRQGLAHCAVKVNPLQLNLLHLSSRSIQNSPLLKLTVHDCTAMGSRCLIRDTGGLQKPGLQTPGALRSLGHEVHRLSENNVVVCLDDVIGPIDVWRSDIIETHEVINVCTCRR